MHFHVLRETRSPAILIEVGFIDNTKDNELFDTKFDEIVKAIAKAILDEVGVKYIENKKPTTGLWQVHIKKEVMQKHKLKN